MPKNSQETPNIREVMSGDKVQQGLDRLTHFVITKLATAKSDVVLVGILTRGVVLAKRIAEEVKKQKGIDLLVGELDITLYRDDFSTTGFTPKVGETRLDFETDGKQIIIIDDVLFTGRTIRAAIDELIDYGRPASISLAVMVDRGHRELPIQADFTAINIATKRDESVIIRLIETDGRDEVVVCESPIQEVPE